MLENFLEKIQDIRAEELLQAALTIDSNRTAEAGTALINHHGFADSGLMLTPFEYQAGLVAMERGVFAWDRTERHFIPPIPADIHPNLSPSD